MTPKELHNSKGMLTPTLGLRSRLKKFMFREKAQLAQPTHKPTHFLEYDLGDEEREESEEPLRQLYVTNSKTGDRCFGFSLSTFVQVKSSLSL
jgi:hypothetical protein